MNGKDLLTELGNIHEKFYMEAENDTLPASPRIRRPLLLAALIALMLLLVGCGVVYMLKMQNLKLGQSQVTEQRWDKEQHTMVEQTLSQQTLTLSGLKGTPSYQAAQEWYEFEQTYDPNHEIINSIWGNIPEFPEKYDFYSPYSQEMVDKIDGICSKYNLKLIDNPVAAQNTRVLLEYLGIDSILLPDAPAQASVDTASYYEVGYFYTDITFQMTEGEDAWPFQSLLSYIYCPKDCFNNELYHLTGDDWQERNYLTKSGREVLILRSPSNWASWVFCDVGDATVALRLETIHQVGTDQNGYQEVIETPMTEEQLNQILDTVNFNLELHPGDPSILEGQNSSTDLSQTQNGYTVEVKQVITDGMQVSVTLGVTAPEDVDLEQYLAEVGSDTYISFYSLRFTPLTDSQFSGGSTSYIAKADNDGKANTVDISVIIRGDVENGIAFPEGIVCNLYLQDLYVDVWNEELCQFDILWSMEGIWNFDITLDEGDWRALEFVSDPITTKSNAGRDDNGNTIFQDVTITSVTLRGFSGIFTGTQEYGNLDLIDSPAGKFPTVVLKDGTEIKLTGYSSMVYSSIFYSEKENTLIPLDEVDHLVLMDGTVLYPLGSPQ